MNLRTLAGRDGAMLLAVAWAALGATALFATASTGVAPSAWLFLPFVPAVVALAGALRRRRDSEDGTTAFGLAVWFAAVLLVASLAATFGATVAGGQRLLEPSPDLLYAGLAAAAATVVHAALGRGWRVRRVLAILGGMASAGAAAGLAAAVALPAGVPPLSPCGTPATAGADRVRLAIEGSVDGTTVRAAVVEARRAGVVETWTAEVVSGPALGASEHVTLGGTMVDGAGVTGRLTGAIARLADPAIEDLGVEQVAGGAARHCRRLVSGPQAFDALPALRWLVEGPLEPDAADVFKLPAEPRASLPVWRGELDWWLAADGRLVMVAVRLGGHPADAWPGRGLRGQLSGTLIVAPVSPSAASIARDRLP